MLRPATIPTLLARTVALLALACALCSPAFAQTPADTIISNQASASYSDGTNSYSTLSNIVTVIVSKVAGLVITPDPPTLNGTVVAGQTLVIYNFTVTNTGNFTDQVRFMAGSARVNAPHTVSRAVIDVDGSGSINVGDTDITSGAPRTSSRRMATSTCWLRSASARALCRASWSRRPWATPRELLHGITWPPIVRLSK